jgi:hypothetical protein
MNDTSLPATYRSAFLGGIGPAAVALAIYTAAVTAYVAIYSGEISCLVCADRNKIGQSPFETVRVGFGSQGFDGQFYYVLARDPWHRHSQHLDYPAYRHSRILYPALAWLLSEGDPERLLWALPAINLAAIAGLAWLGALIAGHYGRSPWWGLFLPVAVNAGPAAFRDLTDPLSMLTACGVVAAWLLGWRAWLLGAWALTAMLSREQNAIVVLIVLLEALLRRHTSRRVEPGGSLGMAAALGLAVCAWVGWLFMVHSAYGTWPFLSQNNDMPLAGILYRLAHATGARGTLSSPVHAVGMALLFLQLCLSCFLLCFRADRIVCLICLGGIGLVALAGVPIFENLESYTRVFWFMPFGIWLWSIQSRRSWPFLLLSTSALLTILALVQAWHTVQRANVFFIH